MKDYKLLLAGLTLLLLIILIAAFTWLWIYNRKHIDPLPIMANENEPTAITEGDDENAVSDNVLHVQIEESLQEPFDEVIVSFESRYPNVQVMANYVPATALLTLPDSTASKSEHSDFSVGIDAIIANGILSTERLTPLQAKLTASQKKAKQNKADASNTDENTKDSEASTVQTNSTETRTLNSFRYALKDEQALEGVILTDNTAAVNFRNFLISSVGQDILKKYDYDNIESYKNSVDDLFNPTSQAKKASDDTSVDVAEVLSNGE